MFKVDLEKKLIDSKKATIKEALRAQKDDDSLLAQANELLEGDSENDLYMLRNLGFQKAIDANRKVQEKMMNKRSVLNNIKSEKVFTIAEIKTICMNYGLRFLDIEHYKGNLPSNIAASIKAAAKETGYDSSMLDLYIIAPKDSFELQAEPKDPLLFAKLLDGSYYLVCKWGDDLNAMRYVSNLPMRTPGTLTLTACITLSLLIFTPVYLIGANGIPALLLFLLSFAILLAGALVFGISSDVEGTNINNWNKKFK